MFFYTSKFLDFVIQPLTWVAVFLIVGLVALRFRLRWGQNLCWLALSILVLMGWQPPVDALMRYLENQSPSQKADANLQKYAGVVLLGGALERSALWVAHPGQVALNSAAERMTVPVGLLQRNPQLRLLFTGGEGNLQLGVLSEADRAKIFFDSMGVPADRVLYESKSRNTSDNAVLSAKLPGVDIHQPWLLLTSAYHMPRSLGVFQKAGWNVTPYPVDYHINPTTTWDAYSIEAGVEKWYLVLHEITGYWAYRLTGRL
jgi:uncharacterized SAM-binding protein YcdF (DUF218 family)